MEELYQDQETIIQQLRLLLAAKEEELNAMRGSRDGAGEGETGESVTDQLIRELEEKKNEVNELRSRVKDIEGSSREKLSRMADALDEKDKIITSLQGGISGGAVEQAPSDPGEAERTIRELEERLKDKERLLDEARRESAPSTATAERMESAGNAEGSIENEITRADLEAAVTEKAKLQTELDELRDEMGAVLKREVELRTRYEDRITELNSQVTSLQGQGQDGRDEICASAAEGNPDPGPARVQEPSSGDADFGGIQARIRILEHDLDEKDLSYRTVQAQLHRLRVTQRMLQGLCAGVSVFLIFTLSMKTKQTSIPLAEAAPPSSLISLTESTAGSNSEAPAPPEIPARTAREPERNRDKDDCIQADPVVQVAARGTARSVDERIAYKVQKGDNLWLICKRVLGKGEAMARIARENRISDPGALKVGDVIYLSLK